ncbi:MAG: tRNA (guanosine(46)-N7)-methyltransferase TrmB [Campylobacterales bacterium]
MPHLIVDRFKAPQTPLELEGIRFEFASGGEEGVIGAYGQEKHFLMRCFKHPKGTILKVDKATRPPLLGLLKKALSVLAQAGGGTVVHSTLSIIKADRQYAGLQEADYFAGGYDYAKPLWIEVGFGSGRHILHNAKNHPDKLHLGIEVHRPSAEQLLRRCEHEGVGNIAVIASDARTVLQTIASASAERIFVHFPVPWDKSPARRVFSHGFIEESVRVLKPRGRLELRTDSRLYFDYAFSLACDLSRAELAVRKNHDAPVSSKYEDRWRRMERDIYDLALTNSVEGEFKPVWYDFGFKDEICHTQTLFERLKGLCATEGGFLLKIRESWALEDGGALLMLTMGSYGAPQTLYLKVQNRKAAYYPALPIPTRESHLAHVALKKALRGE